MKRQGKAKVLSESVGLCSTELKTGQHGLKNSNMESISRVCESKIGLSMNEWLQRIPRELWGPGPQVHRI